MRTLVLLLIGTAVLLVPVAFVATFLLAPFRGWLEGKTGSNDRPFGSGGLVFSGSLRRAALVRVDRRGCAMEIAFVEMGESSKADVGA